MSEARFTKAPWRVHNRGKHWNNSTLEHLEICFGDDGECICDTVYEEANAHLIATAPEMYDVLEKLSKRDTSTDIFNLVLEAEKLLKKARGKHV